MKGISFQRPVNSAFPDYSKGISFDSENPTSEFDVRSDDFYFTAPYDCVMILNVKTKQENLFWTVNYENFIEIGSVGYLVLPLSKGDVFNYHNEGSSNIGYNYFTFRYFRIKGA